MKNLIMKVAFILGMGIFAPQIASADTEIVVIKQTVPNITIVILVVDGVEVGREYRHG